MRHPYFTKLFYFMGQIAPSTLPTTPLIFDKWLKNAYCALSIKAYPKDNTREFFPGIIKSLRMKSIVGEIQCTTGGKLAKLYERFLKDFNHWSPELGVSSHKLEEFVFGLELKTIKHRTKENPRVALWNIISDHYNGKDGAEPKPITLKNLPLTRIGKEKTNSNKYQPLEDYLAEQNKLGKAKVHLSIPEINVMLTSSLPSWAFNKKQDFWGSNNSGHPQKKAWMINGYSVDTSGLNWLNKEGDIRFYKL